ncbi:hypothetical protein [Pseudactinotalea sp.]|uniref:hypothetical protein n=1 Tax=Pseudactinotalea sp. TaxID=1926260 RepID=UPI003B3AAD85
MATHHLRPLITAGTMLALLTGCGLGEALNDGDTKERHADTGAEGKESGLLADWIPDDASDVSVMQRTTGSERLLTFTFEGDLPPECVAIATPGEPTDDELEASYATDPRTADTPLSRWSRTPTLEADWWPEGQLAETTHLCGRWWVSNDEDTVYGFGAEESGG